jgi:hypothetical protein
VRSSRVGLVTQPAEDKAVTKTDKLDSQSENQNLVSGLFSVLENEHDLRLIVERWSELPEHIKAAIKTLVEAHKGKEWRKEG